MQRPTLQYICISYFSSFTLASTKAKRCIRNKTTCRRFIDVKSSEQKEQNVLKINQNVKKKYPLPAAAQFKKVLCIQHQEHSAHAGMSDWGHRLQTVENCFMTVHQEAFSDCWAEWKWQLKTGLSASDPQLFNVTSSASWLTGIKALKRVWL